MNVGFRIGILGIQGLEFRTWNLEVSCEVYWGSSCSFLGLGFRVYIGWQVYELGFRVQGR